MVGPVCYLLSTMVAPHSLRFKAFCGINTFSELETRKNRVFVAWRRCSRSYSLPRRIRDYRHLPFRSALLAHLSAMKEW